MLKKVLALAIATLAITPAHAQTTTMSNQFWWPERLDLAPLRQHAAASSPMDSSFKYAEEFKKLDLKAVTTSPSVRVFCKLARTRTSSQLV